MPKQQLVLHIGANKTGSSAVQSFLRHNRTALQAVGYVVPDKNLELSSQVTGEHVFTFQKLFDCADQGLIEAKLRTLLSSVGDANILISAENLSNNANYKFFGSFLQSIQCKVVLYVRRQDELLTSSWQQWHSKRQSDLDAWLFSAIHKLGRWKRCIDGWESAVGAGNVIVRIFQRADLKNGDVVDDLMFLLGIDCQTAGFAREPGLINPSYSDVITPIVGKNSFIFKSEHDNDFYKFVQDMTGDFYITQKKVSLITRQQRESIIASYKEENQSVAAAHFPGRAELFEKVDHSKYDYLDDAEMLRRQLGFVTSLLYAMWKKKR